MSQIKNEIKSAEETLIATPPSSPEPEALVKDYDLLERLEEIDRAKYKKLWFDPIIVILAYLLVNCFRLYEILMVFYYVHVWPIKYTLSQYFFRQTPIEEYAKIPNHIAIYTSKGNPQRVSLNRLIEKVLEYQVDESRSIKFLTVIVDNDVDLEEYIEYESDERVALYHEYILKYATTNFKLSVNIVRKDGCKRVTHILENTKPRPNEVATMLTLISPIFPVIDLILVLHLQLILQGCMPFHISFSEIKHYPCPQKDIFLGMIEQAIYEYSQCKQNFGK